MNFHISLLFFLLQYSKKSITQNFSKEEIEEFKFRSYTSNATIEHVGSRAKQIKMVENMIDLTENYLIVQIYK